MRTTIIILAFTAVILNATAWSEDYAYWAPDDEYIMLGTGDGATEGDYGFIFDSTDGEFKLVDLSDDAEVITIKESAWTFNMPNAAADSTLTITNSDATYKANMEIEGDLLIGGSLSIDGVDSDEYVTDLVGGMVTGNTETLITVTFEDADNTLDFVVDNDLHLYSWTSVDGTDLKTGTITQAWDTHLDAIAALARTDGNIIVADGSTWVAESGSTARASLGLTIGTHVQAWSTYLDAIAALAVTDGNVLVGDGSTWVAESGSTARTSLGLGSAAIRNAEDNVTNGANLPDGAAIIAYVATKVSDDTILGTQDNTAGSLRVCGDNATDSGELIIDNGGTDDTNTDRYSFYGEAGTGNLVLRGYDVSAADWANILEFDDDNYGMTCNYDFVTPGKIQANISIMPSGMDYNLLPTGTNVCGFGYDNGTLVTGAHIFSGDFNGGSPIMQYCFISSLGLQLAFNAKIGPTTDADLIEMAANELTVNGQILSGENTDTASTFGRAVVGFAATADVATFAHYDCNTAANLALSQTANGATTINVPVGQVISLNEGGALGFRVDPSLGRIGLSTDTDLLQWFSGYLKINGYASIDADADTASAIGRARIGYNGTDSDVATFAHFDNNNAIDFALAQSAAGETIINAAAGQNVVISQNDAPQLTITGTELQTNNSLQFDFATTDGRIRQNANTHFEVESDGLLSLLADPATGTAQILFDATTGDNSDCFYNFGRFTSTTGAVTTKFHKGDGTNTPTVEIDHKTGDIQCDGDLDVDGHDIDLGDAGGFSGVKFVPGTTTLDFWIDGVKVSHVSADGTYTDDVP